LLIAPNIVLKKQKPEFGEVLFSVGRVQFVELPFIQKLSKMRREDCFKFL